MIVRRYPFASASLLLALLILGALYGARIPFLAPLYDRALGRVTLAERLTEIAPTARARLASHFEAAGVPYPPAQFTLAAFKTERRLDLLAADSGGVPRLVWSYPILGASGGVGPKLREGDEQVPEGVYGIESLNPNSRFHVSLRLDYPNAWDRARAAEEGRRHLGGDIMIHGGFASIGCLAMGDAAAEELFVLAADAGPGNGRVLIAPCDFRLRSVDELPRRVDWQEALYAALQAELDSLPLVGPVHEGEAGLRLSKAAAP